MREALQKVYSQVSEPGLETGFAAGAGQRGSTATNVQQDFARLKRARSARRIPSGLGSRPAVAMAPEALCAIQRSFGLTGNHLWPSRAARAQVHRNMSRSLVAWPAPVVNPGKNIDALSQQALEPGRNRWAQLQVGFGAMNDLHVPMSRGASCRS